MNNEVIINDEFTLNEHITLREDLELLETPAITDSRKFYFFFKRLFDIVFSIIALIVLLPVFIIVGIAIKIDSPGSIIFKQKRVGKGGKVFTFYKFRSMVVDAEDKLKDLMDQNEMDKIAFKMKNDPRITKVGRILRKTSIDELPQLINILNGTMSFVGPRPPLPSEVEKYNPYHMQRLAVKGGLTCYWQINGRSNIGFDEWVELDIKYINEMSLWTDLKIMFKTIHAVLKQDGAA